MSNLPEASVIVINLNGRALLDDCLSSLEAQTYPRERFEVILVDNGSTDGSVQYVREAYPHVQVLEAGQNLGFAAANNRGARLAKGELLAFINNDARAEAHWLQAMVEALQRNPEVACVSSKMLSADGQTIDFVGTGMNLFGRAFQIDEGMPASPGRYETSFEILAPCGGAMMVRREAFWQLGGFDEEFVAYYEDVDLGWRLWMAGHKVLLVPEAVAYHKQHQTGSGFSVEGRAALSEANALRMLIKDCEEQYLWKILPTALFTAVQRSLEQAGLDRERYTLGSLSRRQQEASGINGVAAAPLVAIEQVGEELPHLMDRRRSTQALRVLGDAEIFERFPMQTGNPYFPWRKTEVVQEQVEEGLGMPVALRRRRGSRLLIVTHETIGARMAGPGIRAWEMACALAESLDVLLATPGPAGRSHPGVQVLSYDAGDPYYPSLDPYFAAADAVLAMGPLVTRIPRLQDLGKPVVVDLYDPYELEKLAQSPGMGSPDWAELDQSTTMDLRFQALAGDYFICASERQRDFWLGTLLAAGRVNAQAYAQDSELRGLIDVVPFGMPAEPPQPASPVLKGVWPGIGAQDKLLLWNGGLWQWLDPLTLVEALVQVVQTRPEVKLFFASGRHFDPARVPEMPIYAQTVERCRDLGLLERHVFFGDWIPYDERGQYLLEADLGVSTHVPTLESRFASRTRLIDCVWAGLPVLSTAGDPLADWIGERGLGRTVQAGRPDLMAQAILEMLAAPDLRTRVAEQAQEARRELTWRRCVQPVAAFLERAALAPDALQAAREMARLRLYRDQVRELQRVTREKDEMEAMYQARIDEIEAGYQAHIKAIMNGRVMRLMRAFHVLRGEE